MRNRSVLIRLMITNRPYTSLFIEEEGWTLYTIDFRANSANLANNRSTKLGTLICSAHARTFRPTGVDCPDRGLSGLRAGPSARSFWCQTQTLGINHANQHVVWRWENVFKNMSESF
jgi:hypothetical protein